MPTAIAQDAYELRWMETVEEITLLPNADEVSTLTQFELAQAIKHTPDTLARASGYDPARGLYDERRVLNPDRPEQKAWMAPASVYYRRDDRGYYVEDAAGDVVIEEGYIGDNAIRVELAARARAGELSATIASISPGPAGIAELRRQGYTVTTARPLAGRGVPASGSAPLGSAGTALAGVDQAEGIQVVSEYGFVIAEAPGSRVVADAAAGTLTRTTYTDDANADARAHVVSYYQSAAPLGLDGYLLRAEVESRADTLATGRAVVRTRIVGRTGYRYDGPRQRAAAPAADEDFFGSTVNPLLDAYASVIVPPVHAEGPFTLTLTALDGTVVAEEAFAQGSPERLVAFALPAGLAAGTYVLGVRSVAGSATQLLLVP